MNRVAGAPLKKRRGGFHIRPCPLAVRQTSAGAYRMRPYGFRFRQREKTPRGAPPSAGGPPPATKNVGADSISARARLRQDKPPRAHIECAPTDLAFNKGRQLHAGHRLCEGTPPATKNVGADSISARARLRQDKPPRAHIECAPRDSVSDKQGHPQKNAATLFCCKIAWLRLLFWLCV